MSQLLAKAKAPGKLRGKRNQVKLVGLVNTFNEPYLSVLK